MTILAMGFTQLELAQARRYVSQVTNGCRCAVHAAERQACLGSIAQINRFRQTGQRAGRRAPADPCITERRWRRSLLARRNTDAVQVSHSNRSDITHGWYYGQLGGAVKR
jgi:hypothetical protein